MDLAHLVTVGIAVLGTAVLWTVVRSVRRVRMRVRHVGRGLRGVDPRKRAAFARELGTRVRDQANEMRCQQCGGVAFAQLGRDAWWRCDVCEGEFEGPQHVPMFDDLPVSGQLTGV